MQLPVERVADVPAALDRLARVDADALVRWSLRRFYAGQNELSFIIAGSS